MTNNRIIRQHLAERYSEIQQRLERISLDRSRLNQPLNADFEEQAVEIENDQVLDALDGKIRDEMKQIENTLARIDKGGYGDCEDCGQKIAAKRLEALPYAVRCIACEEKFQNRRATVG